MNIIQLRTPANEQTLPYRNMSRPDMPQPLTQIAQQYSVGFAFGVRMAQLNLAAVSVGAGFFLGMTFTLCAMVAAGRLN